LSSLHTLLHHVAELTGHAEVPLALHLVRLDEEHIAANGRPCKANSNARPLCALGDLGINAYLDAAKELVHDLRCDDKLLALRWIDCAFSDATRSFAADRSDELLEPADARLARVMARDKSHARRRKVDVLRRDSVFLDLARNQVALCDIDLLLLGITGEVNDLHTVEQWPRYRIQLVGCADKEHVAQVKRLIKIVVAESIVLLRIQRFKQRAGRVAAEVTSELVDFVQHEDRIVYLNPLQVLDNLARQSADVGPPVTTNLRLVVHTTERDA